MTIKEIEKLKKLKTGTIIEIGQVVIKRDRGQYNVSHGKFIKTYLNAEFNVMCEKIDELLSKSKRKERFSYEVPGTKLIVLKASAGYEVYENGKILEKGLSEKELNAFVQMHKRGAEEKKVTKIRNNIRDEYRMTRQKKTLYYFILVLSVALLLATYMFGIKFNGVSITRTNQELYNVVDAIADVKYPENNLDDFDTVFYTLNYWAKEYNYFMTETYTTEARNIVTGVTEPVVRLNVAVLDNTLIYKHYTDNNLHMDLSTDTTYSGTEFNQLFKDEQGNYVPTDEIIKRIGYIVGDEDISNIEDLVSAYVSWDDQDNKSNRAYNYEAFTVDGSRLFDYTTGYYTTFLARNSFVRLFISDPSNFVHEYNMFESIGWLTWTSFAVFILYVLLAFSVWVFRKDSIKISKALVIIITVLFALILVPLTLQYFFEGLSKNATQFLDVVENTKFTTTTTMMNFFFDYIIKFSNILLTGILTIALPLKVVRYFVLDAVSKLDKAGAKQITKTLANGVSITEDLTSPDWRM